MELGKLLENYRGNHYLPVMPIRVICPDENAMPDIRTKLKRLGITNGYSNGALHT
jgi:hypothetical protein